MASSPQLKNHLIHQLINTTRLKSDGDAMVLLALSGKEPFSIFRYVVEARAHAYTDRGDIVIKCSSPYTPLSAPLEFETEASKRLVIRFVRDLLVDSSPSKDLPFEKITNLTIRHYAKPFTSILNSWTDLEVLKMCDISDAFFDDFFDDFVNTSLPNLRKLELGLTLKGCIKLMTVTPPVPLPEDVTLLLTVRERALAAFDSPNTFPTVKHLTATVQVWTELTVEVLNRLSTIINCFTGLETAKLELSYDHHPGKKEFEGIVNFHEWLRNTKFSAPIEIDFKEFVDISYNEDIESVYAQLKSIGFEEDGIPFYLVMKKEFGNVKLVHRVEHYDATSDNEELWADEVQDFLNDLAVDDDVYSDGDFSYDDDSDEAF
uniref:F-box domain-containing protein n=1 Tax=Panagrellus redivivus TaxID=6233 RepID=A0A7E4W1Y1_PANRE